MFLNALRAYELEWWRAGAQRAGTSIFVSVILAPVRSNTKLGKSVTVLTRTPLTLLRS